MTFSAPSVVRIAVLRPLWFRFTARPARSPLASSSEQPTAPTTCPTRTDLTQRLVVQEQRDERRQLPNLLRRQQRLRSRSEDSHLIERFVLGGTHTVVRLVDVVFV